MEQIEIIEKEESHHHGITVIAGRPLPYSNRGDTPKKEGLPAKRKLASEYADELREVIRCIHAQDPTLSSIAGYQAKTFNDIFSKRQETPTEHLIAILDHLENWFRSQSRQSVFTRGDTPDPDRPDLAQITESGTPVPKKEVHPPTQTTASPEKPVKKTLAARRPPRSSVPSPPPRPD
ncbi:MAG: hypothetical protein WC295_07020, partial [Methanoregula sp.]